MKEWIQSVRAISLAAIASTSVVATIGILSFVVTQCTSSEKDLYVNVEATSKEINLVLTVRTFLRDRDQAQNLGAAEGDLDNRKNN